MNLSFDEHVTGVVRSNAYHIGAIRHIRQVIDPDTNNTVACSIVCTRLSYRNAIFYGVSESNIDRLQRVQNALARVVCTTTYRSTAIHRRQSLHWLPISQRITYKITKLTFKVRLHSQPVYLVDLTVAYSHHRDPTIATLSRQISNWCCKEQGVVCFKFITVCRSAHVEGLADHIRSSATVISFRLQFKSHIFNITCT